MVSSPLTNFIRALITANSIIATIGTNTVTAIKAIVCFKIKLLFDTK